MNRIIAPFAGFGFALVVAALGGCVTITQQDAAAYSQAFCVLSADGAVLAVALTKGGAEATAQKLATAQPVACSTATVVGQVIANP